MRNRTTGALACGPSSECLAALRDACPIWCRFDVIGGLAAARPMSHGD